MKTDANHPADSVAPSASTGRRNSYSRRRWSAFDAWQEHIRRSAAHIGVAFPARPDRDLRRASVPG